MMGRITAIKPQERRPKRCSIFVDGKFAAGVDGEIVLTLGLKVGQQVDEERLREMLRAEEVRRAREAALNLLAYRSRSSKEIERRLKQKGYEEDIIADVIAGLQRVDLVNDERFASDWVSSRMAARPMGRSRLQWELRQKGVDGELIEEALREVDEDREFEAALGVAENRVDSGRSIEIAAEKRRLAGLLQRRGFGWETVKRVLDRIFGGEEEC